MRIAVTGASGFIGRHVVRVLLERGHDVWAAGRNAGRLSSVNERARTVQFDVTEANSECFERLGRPDVLVHLAWGGLPNYKSLHHFEDELPTHYRFLKEMIGGGLGAAVVSGTCFEYGMQSGPLREEMAAAPCTAYGFAKDGLRRRLEFLAQERPFRLTWARLFYLHGPGQAETPLYAQLRKAVERGDGSFDMSGGEQLRDYLAVEEAARLLVTLAERTEAIGVVNVCSGKPVSVRGMVERWMTENDWRLRLNLGQYPYPDYEPMAFWGDRTKLDRMLGSD